jgi:hypothetical protein
MRCDWLLTGVVAFGVTGCAKPAEPRKMSGQAVRPREEVQSLLDFHPDWGKPLEAVDLPSFGGSLRQRVRLSSGRALLFEVRSGRVVSVWESDANGRPIPVR